MTKLRLLGAAAILASALASPAMAQQNKGPGNPYTGDYQRRIDYRDNGNWNNGWRESRNHTRWDGHDSAFWNAAAGVGGGAVGTADAIATAPFRSDSYARYNDGFRGGYDDSYAVRNGFVCQPGTWFRGDDGRRHLCQ